MSALIDMLYADRIVGEALTNLIYRDPIEATTLFEELPIGAFFAWKQQD